MEFTDGEPVPDRPAMAEVEAYVETAGPDTRAVRLRPTASGPSVAVGVRSKVSGFVGYRADGAGRWRVPSAED
ncbi:hypothetical protein [Nocardioides luteus]|uniref:Uncharacterized protein n=1 Tax=Nocardioides luteus TaxID=1844 RepID=A0A1J4NBX5_9ACTN|nr:hypothetical protein [Nocardioides luteus]OIJ27977.1 hypothetical protein UG56_004555 [Nocardioides luteus]